MASWPWDALGAHHSAGLFHESPMENEDDPKCR